MSRDGCSCLSTVSSRARFDESCGYTAVRNAAAKDGLWKISGGRQIIYARADLSERDRIIAAERLADGLRFAEVA
jgi:hypothetical protein